MALNMIFDTSIYDTYHDIQPLRGLSIASDAPCSLPFDNRQNPLTQRLFDYPAGSVIYVTGWIRFGREGWYESCNPGLAKTGLTALA